MSFCNDKISFDGSCKSLTYLFKESNIGFPVTNLGTAWSALSPSSDFTRASSPSYWPLKYAFLAFWAPVKPSKNKVPKSIAVLFNEFTKGMKEFSDKDENV